MDEQLEIAQKVIGAQQIEIEQYKRALQIVGQQYQELKAKYEPEERPLSDAEAEEILRSGVTPLNRSARRAAAKTKPAPARAAKPKAAPAP